MIIRCILFGIDDTLYDASLQRYLARMNAVRAMIEAGLPVDPETTFNTLKAVVAEYGEDYDRHFDRMLERLGLRVNTRIIAAAVAAYHDTKFAYLRPHPETVPTLIVLRERGYKIGVASAGNPVKQWEKLIRLGLQHLFHHVVIAKEVGCETLERRVFEEALKVLDSTPKESLFVGCSPSEELAHAKAAGLLTVRVKRGAHRLETPKTLEETPDYEVSTLTELLRIIGEADKRET
ncbi:MAG: TIGR02253 family HAD-type hydrolase [Candidatus Freyarchaeota archaeon]|nr:TIGR02253 family HAD-type hydrolase [Candidatus Jordarchaeia archaeon]